MRSLALGWLLLLCGCGALQSPAPAAGFVNRTPQSAAFLMAEWQAAQHDVAAGGVDLTRIRTILQHTAPVFLPPDPRGLTVAPHGLLVDSVPDARPGQVACPAPCDVSYSVAYSLYGESVVYAASWNHKPSDLASILEYEFVSQILYQLRYDVSWR